MPGDHHDKPELAAGAGFPVETAKMAYVKAVHEEGQRYYAVYGSEGQPLAIAPERMLAFVMTRQHDLVPVDVH